MCQEPQPPERVPLVFQVPPEQTGLPKQPPQWERPVWPVPLAQMELLWERTAPTVSMALTVSMVSGPVLPERLEPVAKAMPRREAAGRPGLTDKTVWSVETASRA